MGTREFKTWHRHSYIRAQKENERLLESFVRARKFDAPHCECSLKSSIKFVSFNKIAVAECKDRIVAMGVAECNLAEARLVTHRRNRKFAEDTDSAVRRIDLD